MLSMGTMGRMILGRPWLFDLNVLLREKSNTCTLTYKGQQIKSIPSQPKTEEQRTCRTTREKGSQLD